MDQHRLLSMTMYGRVQRQRNRGRPKKRSFDTLKANSQETDWNLTEAQRTTQDRVTYGIWQIKHLHLYCTKKKTCTMALQSSRGQIAKSKLFLLIFISDDNDDNDHYCTALSQSNNTSHALYDDHYCIELYKWKHYTSHALYDDHYYITLSQTNITRQMHSMMITITSHYLKRT